jgi:predicted negative regulator of RcsB-dependent stress response
LVSLGKNAEAKEAYEQALTKLEPKGKFRALTQQKLESLG